MNKLTEETLAFTYYIEAKYPEQEPPYTDPIVREFREKYESAERIKAKELQAKREPTIKPKNGKYTREDLQKLIDSGQKVHQAVNGSKNERQKVFHRMKVVGLYDEYRAKQAELMAVVVKFDDGQVQEFASQTACRNALGIKMYTLRKALAGKSDEYTIMRKIDYLAEKGE